MYSPMIYKRLASVVWSNRLRPLYFLTLGYMNVYLLNLYYIRFRYSRYELTQYRINVIYSVLVMFPILNIPVYIASIRRSKLPLLFSDATKLYLQGRLVTYMIQKDYSTLIESKTWKDTILLIIYGLLVKHSSVRKAVLPVERVCCLSHGRLHF